MNNSKQVKGRPINPEKQAMQKAKLLASAEYLLAEKSYSNITIRELAQHSGVNLLRYSMISLQNTLQ